MDLALRRLIELACWSRLDQRLIQIETVPNIQTAVGWSYQYPRTYFLIFEIMFTLSLFFLCCFSNSITS